MARLSDDWGIDGRERPAVRGHRDNARVRTPDTVLTAQVGEVGRAVSQLQETE